MTIKEKLIFLSIFLLILGLVLYFIYRVSDIVYVIQSNYGAIEF